MIIKLLTENLNDNNKEVAYLPKNQLDAFNNIYRDYYRNYNIEKVKIDDLLRDDPGLNDNDDLGSYHEMVWGDDINKYEYDPNKNNRGSDIPSVVYRNNKYHISDGRHRIKALANSGYKYVELPVLREMLLEDDNADAEDGGEEIRLTSHLNYPNVVYDYVFRVSDVSFGRNNDTLVVRFTKGELKDNIDGYPFVVGWYGLNLKAGSQLSFLTSEDAITYVGSSAFPDKKVYMSKTKQKVVRIDVNGEVPCYVGVDYINNNYGAKMTDYIHPVIQKRLKETPVPNNIASAADKQQIDNKNTTKKSKNSKVLEYLENLKNLTEQVNGTILNWEGLDLANNNSINNIEFILPIKSVASSVDELVNIVPGRYLPKEVCEQINQLRIRPHINSKKFLYSYLLVKATQPTAPSVNCKTVFTIEKSVTDINILDVLEKLNDSKQMNKLLKDLQISLGKYFEGVWFETGNTPLILNSNINFAEAPKFTFLSKGSADWVALWMQLHTAATPYEQNVKLYNNVSELLDVIKDILKVISSKAPWDEVYEDVFKTALESKKYVETKRLKLSDLRLSKK